MFAYWERWLICFRVLLHELLHQQGVAQGRSACDSAEVLCNQGGFDTTLPLVCLTGFNVSDPPFDNITLILNEVI